MLDLKYLGTYRVTGSEGVQGLRVSELHASQNKIIPNKTIASALIAGG
jgi:hypothetical protein